MKPGRTFLTAVMLLCLTAPAPAQEKDREEPPPAGSLPPDSTHTAVADSLFRWDLRPWAGSLTLTDDSLHGIRAAAIAWMTPVSAADVLATVPGIWIADPSSAGQYLRPYVRGTDWRGTVVLVDGVPVNDPLAGTFNLSLLPIGMADRVETVIGTRSFLYAAGATGGAVNLVRPRRSHTVPVTHINYEESAYGYAKSEGSFLQDISRRVSVTAGYQYQGTEGRFENSGHTQWNMRGGARYHFGPGWDVTGHYLYTQTKTGLNNGTDLSRTSVVDAFSEALSVMRNTDAYEKITRHDITVQLAGSFMADSTARTTVTAFSTHLLREYRDEENRSDPNGIFLAHDHRIARTGVQVRQRMPLGFQTFSAELLLDHQRIVSSPVMGSPATTAMSAALLDEIALGGGSVWSVYGRLDHLRHHAHLGFGSDIRVQLGRALTVAAGFSIARRPLSFAELFWSDGTQIHRPPNGLPEAERHTTGEASVTFSLGSTGSLTATYTIRSIRDLIVVDGGPYEDVRPQFYLTSSSGSDVVHAVDLGMRWSLAWFTLEGNAGFVRWENTKPGRRDEIPRGYARGGLYYRNTILNGELELQAGVRGQVRGQYDGSTLFAEQLFPLLNTQSRMGAAAALDLVLIGHIGDAYVHVLWENVANTEYFTTPFTPALDRRFRFGISWEFLN